MGSTPFDSLDSAHEYLRLLAIQVTEVTEEIQQDLASGHVAADARQVEALRLVAFKLQQLGMHLTASRGVMNDLRMLRRILLGGSTPVAKGRHSRSNQ